MLFLNPYHSTPSPTFLCNKTATARRPEILRACPQQLWIKTMQGNSLIFCLKVKVNCFALCATLCWAASKSIASAERFKVIKYAWLVEMCMTWRLIILEIECFYLLDVSWPITRLVMQSRSQRIYRRRSVRSLSVAGGHSGTMQNVGLLCFSSTQSLMVKVCLIGSDASLSNEEGFEFV